MKRTPEEVIGWLIDRYQAEVARGCWTETNESGMVTAYEPPEVFEWLDELQEAMRDGAVHYGDK